MPDNEFAFRLMTAIPLAIITFQVLMLRRILTSRAWTLLASGFLLFLVMRVTTLFVYPFPTIAGLVAFIVGYAIIVVGFHTLRDDLHRVIRRAERNPRDEVMR